MFWIIVYAIGIVVMYGFLKVQCPNNPTLTRDERVIEERGTMMLVLLWPITAPIMLLMWMKCCMDDAAHQRRYEDWSSKMKEG